MKKRFITSLSIALVLGFVGCSTSKDGTNLSKNDDIQMPPNKSNPIETRSVVSSGDIHIDGSSRDWANVNTFVKEGVNLVKIANDENNLYFMTSGNLDTHVQFLIDVDNNPNTGYKHRFFGNAAGADYLIEDNELYRATENGSHWKFKYVKPVKINRRGGFFEALLPKNDLNNLTDNIKVATTYRNSSWKETTTLPNRSAKEYFLQTTQTDNSPAVGVVVVEKKVSSSSDDVEEQKDGSIYISSSDLELTTTRNGVQVVGIRITNLDIPQGAKIKKAYLQFQTDEDSNWRSTVYITAEDSPNALTFSSNKRDVSSRNTVATSVEWSPPEWHNIGERGISQRTSDLSSIIQPIVNKSDTSSIAFIITGEARRVAESYDGDRNGAPMLHVEYTTDDEVVEDNAVKLPIVELRFDECSISDGSILKDERATFNATVKKEVLLEDSVINNGIKLDGKDDYVKLPPMDVDYSKGFTFSSWVKFDNDAGVGGVWETVFSLGTDDKDKEYSKKHNYEIWLNRYYNENKLYFAFTNGNRDNPCADIKTVNDVLTPGVMQHIAVTIDDRNYPHIFIDGEEVATTVAWHNAGGACEIPSVLRDLCYIGKPNDEWLGLDNDGGHKDHKDNNFLKGSIDEVEIFNQTLSAKDIQDLYIAQKSGLNTDKTSRVAVVCGENSDDNIPPIITLNGSSNITLNIGDNYVDAKAVASDNVDGDISSSIITSGSVDSSKAGTYILTYSVSDSAGNNASISRTIVVKDLTKPQVNADITVDANPSDWVDIADMGTSGDIKLKVYSDDEYLYFLIDSPTKVEDKTVLFINSDNLWATGYQASGWANSGFDYAIGTGGSLYKSNTNSARWSWSQFADAVEFKKNSKTIEMKIKKSDFNLGNSFEVGAISYNASWDPIVSLPLDNKLLSYTRGGVDNSVDQKAPIILLKGSSNINIKVGDAFVDLGAKAEDEVDGDLTTSITKRGVVDTSTIGSYVITYSVSDKAGNIATVKRTVVVSAAGENREINIEIDGDLNDWVNIPEAGVLDDEVLKVYTDDIYAYFLLASPSGVNQNMIFFINSDNISATGYQANEDWVLSGADYAIGTGGKLYIAKTNDSQWLWDDKSLGSVEEIKKSPNVIEVKVKKSDFNLGDTFEVGVRILDESWNKIGVLPQNRLYTYIKEGSDGGVDTVKPSIILNGALTVSVNQGGVYNELGAQAYDNVDKEVAVRVSGSVDTSTIGTYTITYSAVDSAGNSSSKIRTVIVRASSVADAIINIDGDTSDWAAIDGQSDGVNTIKTYTDSEYAYFMIESTNIANPTAIWFIDGDNNDKTGYQDDEEWAKSGADYAIGTTGKLYISKTNNSIWDWDGESLDNAQEFYAANGVIEIKVKKSNFGLSDSYRVGARIFNDEGDAMVLPSDRFLSYTKSATKIPNDNGSSFDEIKAILSSGDATYISVGDSTRANSEHYGNGEVFKTVSQALGDGVRSILQAKPGHTAAEWSSGESTPTWQDTVNAIEGDGSNSVVNISLGINDIRYFGDKNKLKSSLIDGINKILELRPNTKIMLTMPNLMVNIDSSAYVEVYKELSTVYPMVDTQSIFENASLSLYRDADAGEYGQNIRIHLSKDGQNLVSEKILQHIK